MLTRGCGGFTSLPTSPSATHDLSQRDPAIFSTATSASPPFGGSWEPLHYFGSLSNAKAGKSAVATDPQRVAHSPSLSLSLSAGGVAAAVVAQGKPAYVLPLRTDTDPFQRPSIRASGGCAAASEKSPTIGGLTSERMTQCA